MAAPMTPDIREGAATMTRGLREHKKNKMAPDIRVRKKRWQQI